MICFKGFHKQGKKTDPPVTVTPEEEVTYDKAYRAELRADVIIPNVTPEERVFFIIVFAVKFTCTLLTFLYDCTYPSCFGFYQ